jgi:hypothetical protein
LTFFGKTFSGQPSIVQNGVFDYLICTLESIPREVELVVKDNNASFKIAIKTINCRLD